jgi:RNA polymerase sigma-54 factor
MQKSLEVLQMPLEELSLWLQSEIEQNPYLEWDENSYCLWNTPYTRVDKLDTPYKPSLFEHLLEQAKIAFTNPFLLEIATWIIGNLEPTGFLPLEPLQCPLSYTSHQWQQCLTTIQQFDPPGIAAKDLQESLLLQLKITEKENSLPSEILKESSQELITHNFIDIQKKHGISKTELQKALKELSSLNPYPGHAFSQNNLPPPPIDIILEAHENSFELEVLQPRVLFKEHLAESLNTEEKKICKQYDLRARQVLSSLEKRASTLQKIANYLISKQKAYLIRETEILSPISAKMIAEEFNLHESTITRALAHKHLSCPRGIIPLKDLLSSALSENISSDAAQKLLKKWILEENKLAPLSDKEILEKMKGLGIPCARRTITKYRHLLQIPSSRARLKRDEETTL